jgi:alpha-beta hydrolase superfamily lysophospholipase
VRSVAHGTTGIVPGCAPSLSPAPFADGAGTALARLVVDHGWVGVISDYVGLGTAGPHAYLVGQAAARNVLDATRAAGQLGQLRLDRRTVVWGHSQGGHGAIWAGSIGPRYAPELDIVGVAALAPATDLDQLATGVKNTTFGRVVSAYLAGSWAAYYPQLDMDRLVDRRYRRTVSRIGQRCFSGRDALAAAAITSQLFGPIFTASALSGTFADLLRANSPHELVSAPLLVAQGDADPLVLPTMQRRWVAARCAAGQRLDVRSYRGLDHLSLVAADSPLTPALVAWGPGPPGRRPRIHHLLSRHPTSQGRHRPPPACRPEPAVPVASRRCCAISPPGSPMGGRWSWCWRGCPRACP